jgi:FkbM family methyltransferase
MGHETRIRDRAAGVLAHIGRHTPIEKGHWRFGRLAERCLSDRERTELIRTRDGLLMEVDLREFVDRTIYCTGVWEPHETSLIKSLLREGDAFIDVGANIGYFSLLAAKIVGPSGRVEAVEGAPATAELLRRNVDLNAMANVAIHPVAVSDRPGRARMIEIERGNCGGNRLDFDGPGDEGWAVELTTLDELLPQARYSLLKMDIEGAEAKAFRGAERLLAGDDAPNLIFEFTPEYQRKMGDDPRELLRFLGEKGYAIYRCDGECLSPAVEEELLATKQSYLFCAKRLPDSLAGRLATTK